MASFRQFGKAHLLPFARQPISFFGGKYRILDQILRFEPWLKKRFPTLRAQLFEGRLANPCF